MLQIKWPDYAYTKLGSSSTGGSPSNVRRLLGTAGLFLVTFYLVLSLLKTSQELVNNNDEERPLEEGQVEFTLERCGCRRRLTSITAPNDIFFNQTTCGKDAFQRGPGQKIVGFSFYGDINSDYRYLFE